MERVIFDHLYTEEEINKLPKESAEYEHWQRYKWIAYRCKNKKVLDISCGTGYGSELIAINGSEVIGVDISKEAIDYAKSHFSHAEFQIGDAENLSFDDNTFDIVVSFETIEHLNNPEKFISQVNRVLKKDGLFVGSIPREFDTPEFRQHNPFHKNFYGNLIDLQYLLSQFKEIKVISQLNDIIDGYDETKTKYFIFKAQKPEDFVQIVIPTYNSQEVFDFCYQGLLQAGYPHSIVAIDNASKDKKYLNRIGIEKIFNDKNYKFTHAVNQGLKFQAPYTLLLNPDCSGNLQKAWLRTMVEELESNHAGISGAILKFPDGKIQHAGAYSFGSHIGFKEDDKGQFDKVREVEWVTGACMLIKREVIDKIGEWDEVKYPHYESDREWCKKAKEAGIKIICSTAKLSHLEGRSSIEPIKKHERKLRILWHSNSAWTPTGYGVQTSLVTKALHKAGYPIAISSYYGLEGGILNLDGITCYPKMSMVWGEDAMVNHAKDFQADIVIALCDIWILQTALFKGKINWISQTPIDHDEVPNPVEVRAREAYKVISYSKHGFEAFKRKKIESTYIPHCVNTKIFKPCNKKDSRRIFGIPENAYVVGMVAQNKSGQPSRKSFQAALEGFKIFAKDKPHARIYLHTIMDQSQQGINLVEYCNHLGILDKVIYTFPYNYLFKFGPEELAKLYSSFDVLLNPSMGEGFGVPIVEAEACGIPVIIGDWTSMPELLGAGEKVGWSEKFWTPLAAYMFFPKLEDIVQALEKIYHGDKEEYKQKAVDFTKQYDVDIVVEKYWKPFLESI
jgi:GT2 family glycosyltransferase/ubiquinone/menaquinone biosynthesis C-methylase UbiE